MTATRSNSTPRPKATRSTPEKLNISRNPSAAGSICLRLCVFPRGRHALTHAIATPRHCSRNHGTHHRTNRSRNAALETTMDARQQRPPPAPLRHPVHRYQRALSLGDRRRRRLSEPQLDDLSPGSRTRRTGQARRARLDQHLLFVVHQGRWRNERNRATQDDPLLTRLYRVQCRPDRQSARPLPARTAGANAGRPIGAPGDDRRVFRGNPVGCPRRRRPSLLRPHRRLHQTTAAHGIHVGRRPCQHESARARSLDRARQPARTNLRQEIRR